MDVVATNIHELRTDAVIAKDLRADKQCDCLNKVNAELKQHGLRLSTCVLLNMETGKSRESVFMTTEKLAPRSKTKRSTVCPTFCPFCGERLKAAA